MFRFHQEHPEDDYEVEYLFDHCFAPGRTALSSYRLRDDVPPVADLCLTARDAYDTLAAAIRYWPVRIGPAGDPALLLGPVAVHPTHQGEGLGAELIASSLHRAAETGWTRVLLVGDEPYYRRFGFTRALTRHLRFPPPTNPDRFLGRALKEGAFEGVRGTVRKWTQGPVARSPKR